MTTIATDGKTIAADSLSTFGTERSSKAVEKIIVRPDAIYANDGTAGVLPALVAWVEAGAEHQALPKFGDDNSWSMIVIKRGGIWRVSSTCPVLQEIGFPWAFGSGGDYAIGAMHAGKTPREAVEIAAMLDVYTGGPITVVDIASALSPPVPQAAE